jgi:hypothetical protein
VFEIQFEESKEALFLSGAVFCLGLKCGHAVSLGFKLVK